MKFEEMMGYMNSNSEIYSAHEGKHHGESGLFVVDKRHDIETFLTLQAIEENNRDTLLILLHQGRNVEMMTRVTGFFSKTSGWNKGKTGELKERIRSTV